MKIIWAATIVPSREALSVLILIRVVAEVDDELGR
jgi:hypothetical protein